MEQTIRFRFNGYVEVKCNDSNKEEAIRQVLGEAADCMRNNNKTFIADIDKWWESLPSFSMIDDFMSNK